MGSLPGDGNVRKMFHFACRSERRHQGGLKNDGVLCVRGLIFEKWDGRDVSVISLVLGNKRNVEYTT